MSMESMGHEDASRDEKMPAEEPSFDVTLSERQQEELRRTLESLGVNNRD